MDSDSDSMEEFLNSDPTHAVQCPVSPNDLPEPLGAAVSRSSSLSGGGEDRGGGGGRGRPMGGCVLAQVDEDDDSPPDDVPVRPVRGRQTAHSHGGHHGSHGSHGHGHAHGRGHGHGHGHGHHAHRNASDQPLPTLPSSSSREEAAGGNSGGGGGKCPVSAGGGPAKEGGSGSPGGSLRSDGSPTTPTPQGSGSGVSSAAAARNEQKTYDSRASASTTTSGASDETSGSGSTLADVMDVNEFESSHLAMVVADERLTIVNMNSAALKFFGYDDPEEIVGCPVVALIPENSDHHRRHGAYYNAYKKKRKKRLMASTRVLPAAMADGSTKMVEITLASKRVGDNLDALYIATFKEARGLIAEIELVGVPILVADSSLCITSINKRCLALLERPRGSVIGRDVSCLVGPRTRRMGGDFLRKFIAEMGDIEAADEQGHGQRRDSSEDRDDNDEREGTVSGTVQLGTGAEINIVAVIKVDPRSIASHFFVTLSLAAEADSPTASSAGLRTPQSIGAHSGHAGGGGGYGGPGGGQRHDSVVRVDSSNMSEVEALQRQVEELNARLQAAQDANASSASPARDESQMSAHGSVRTGGGGPGSDSPSIAGKGPPSMMTPRTNSGERLGPAAAPRFLEISLRDIKVLEKIGSGGFAKVYRGLWMGKEVALKKLRSDINADVIQSFLLEMNMLANLRHPNVVLMLGALSGPKGHAIVTEYLHNGSLYHYIANLNEKGERIPDAQLREFALDIAHGLSYLHSLKPPVIHRDLKSLNVLIDRSFSCKVADFGLSREMHDSGLATASTGTPHWVAPEVLAGQKYTEKVDVYSYAVVLWEMLTMERPFAGMNPFNLISLFLRDPAYRLEIPPHVPEVWANLVRMCWAVEPSDRPSFRDIVRYLSENIPPEGVPMNDRQAAEQAAE